MTVEEHVKDLLPAYALGCLDEDENTRVVEHLARCTVCQAELRAYAAIADSLPLSVPQFDPPIRVKAGLMERVAAHERASNATVQPVRPASAAPGRTTVWERVSVFFRRAAPALSLASLALVVTLVASNLFLWRQVNDLRSAQPTALSVINLTGTSAAPQATGLIVISSNREHGTLVVDDLPTLGEDQQYQLWLIKNGMRTSGGVFSVSKDGYGSLWVGSPQPLGDYNSFGITIEPYGGSPGPTGDKVLGGELW